MKLILSVLISSSLTGIQGIGNTVLPMVSGVAEFVMRTGSTLLLPVVLGQDGIFYAEISA